VPRIKSTRSQCLNNKPGNANLPIGVDQNAMHLVWQFVDFLRGDFSDSLRRKNQSIKLFFNPNELNAA
jgi:hypothetical protein